MKKVVSLLLCFFLLVGYIIVPSDGVEASSSVAQVVSPKAYTHYGGTTFAVKKFTFPKTVKVRLTNGKVENRSVKWSNVSFQKEYLNRTQRVIGTVQGTSKKAVWSVRIKNYPVRVTAPVIRSVGKGQRPTLPNLLTVHFINGQRSTYKLAWNTPSTASLGSKNATYRASGLNVAFTGQSKLVVRDVQVTQPVFTILTNNEQIQATGKILYPAKGVRHYLVAENRLTKKQVKKNIFPESDGSYRVPSLPLDAGSYNVFVQSGLKKTSPVVVTIKGNSIPEDTETDVRNLLKGLLGDINVSNPLLQDIVFPSIDGVAFSIESNNAALSANGKVTRGALDQVVNFTIRAKKGAVTESKSFSNIVIPKVALSDAEELDLWLDSIQVNNPLTQNIQLPTYPGVVFAIQSSNNAVVSPLGNVTRGLQDQVVNLVITATKGNLVRSKSFPNITVPKLDQTPESLIDDYLNKLMIPNPLLNNVVLPPLAGATVSLTSSNQGAVTNTGLVVRGLVDQNVSLVVTVTKDGVTKAKSFLDLKVPKRDGATDEILEDYLAKLTIPNPLLTNVSLPALPGGVATLVSTNPAVLAGDGALTRGLTDQTIGITVTAVKDGVTKTRTFSGIVVPKRDGAIDEVLDDYLAKLNIASPLTANIVLPPLAGATVTLNSSNPAIVSNLGVLTRGPGDQTVSITVTASKDGVTKSRTFPNLLVPKDDGLLTSELDAALNAINLGTLDNVTNNISLPSQSNGIPVTWQSQQTDVISNGGVIQRDASLAKPFTLIASVTKNGLTRTKSFSGTVAPNAQLLLAEDIAKIKSAFGTLHPVYDLNLPTTLNGTPLTWTSSNQSLLTDTGKVGRTNAFTPFTLTASNESVSQVINMSTQDLDLGLLGGLLSGLLNDLGEIVNPIVNALGTNNNLGTLPKNYGGVSILGQKTITGWQSSHPDIVKINGYNVTLERGDQERLVVLRAKFEGITQPVPIIVKVPKR